MIEKIGALLESFIRFHEKLGIKYITMYVIYILIIIAAVNWRSILTEISDTMESHKQQKHVELLKERDNLNYEISDIVIDLRRDLGADRVFIVEYHNTISNLNGIPFKFMSVTSNDSKRGVDQLDVSKYNQLNTGLFTAFLKQLREDVYLEFRDVDIQCEMANICTLLHGDGAKDAAICQITGVSIPLGFIVVEWTSRDELQPIDWEYSRKRIFKSAQVINALLTNSKLPN